MALRRMAGLSATHRAVPGTLQGGCEDAEGLARARAEGSCGAESKHVELEPRCVCQAYFPSFQSWPFTSTSPKDSGHSKRQQLLLVHIVRERIPPRTDRKGTRAPWITACLIVHCIRRKPVLYPQA